MTPLAALILLIYAVTAIFAAASIGNRKGLPLAGFLLGFFLGWIGVAIIALMSPTHDALVRRERNRLQIQREAQGEVKS